MTGRRRAQALERGNVDYGRRLALLRKAAGLSQSELAEKLGIAQSLISRYEKGERRMYDDMLATTAKILGVSTDELLGITSPTTNHASKLADDPDLRRLWRKFQQVAKWPEKDRDAVIRIINTISTSHT